MNYSYFGQVGQNTSSTPPSNQTLNTQPTSPINQQQNNPFNMNQAYQMNQPLFPQPTGSVYNLSTASEIGNVPTGLGISVGLCLPENILYVKALQNGSPVLLGYRLSPLGESQNTPTEQVDQQERNEEFEKEAQKMTEVLKRQEERIQRLENQLVKIKDKVGGKTEWQF